MKEKITLGKVIEILKIRSNLIEVVSPAADDSKVLNKEEQKYKIEEREELIKLFKNRFK